MTDGELDALLSTTTWNVFVEHILCRILAEDINGGSAHAILGSVMRFLYEKGAATAPRQTLA